MADPRFTIETIRGAQRRVWRSHSHELGFDLSVPLAVCIAAVNEAIAGQFPHSRVDRHDPQGRPVAAVEAHRFEEEAALASAAADEGL